MGEKKYTEAEARYLTVKTALDLACETVSRQHGISVLDAQFALTVVALDYLFDIAPGPMRKVCETRAAVRLALARDDEQALKKAVRDHDRATDLFYDAGMARFARAKGELN